VSQLTVFIKKSPVTEVKVIAWFRSGSLACIFRRSAYIKSRGQGYCSSVHVSLPKLLNDVRVKQTNLMHNLSSVYFVSQPLHVSGMFVAHHQGIYCVYIHARARTHTHTHTQNNWYVLCFLVDCLLANRQSTKKHNMSYKHARNIYRLIDEINWR
jgi:hypothetical protein